MKHIKIPLPKWNWWQTALVLGFIVVVVKSDPNVALEGIKELIKKWLLE